MLNITPSSPTVITHNGTLLEVGKLYALKYVAGSWLGLPFRSVNGGEDDNIYIDEPFVILEILDKRNVHSPPNPRQVKILTANRGILGTVWLFPMDRIEPLDEIAG